MKEGDLEKKAQHDNHEELWKSSGSRRANAKNQYNGAKPVILKRPLIYWTFCKVVKRAEEILSPSSRKITS
jgi:hypothetical protein